MKKLIEIILLLCLVATICACSNQNNNSALLNQSNDSLDSEFTENIVTLEGGERPLLTLSSIEDYKKMLSSIKLPQEFISYEKINHFGDFKALVFLSDTGKNDFSKYMYYLVDSSGYEIALYLNYNSSNDTIISKDSITNVNSLDMRLIPEKSNGKYSTQGIVYEYVLGQLLSISWEHQGVFYTLTGTSMLCDYPSTDSTVVGKMLNVNNASVTLRKILSFESE